jgi:hypothetical protein
MLKNTPFFTTAFRAISLRPAKGPSLLGIFALDTFWDTACRSGGQKGAKAVPASENPVRLVPCGTRLSAVGHHYQ